MKKEPNIQDELQQMAPLLAAIPKANPFRVPDNYFQALPQAINEKLALQKKQSWKWEACLHFLLQPRYTASVALLAIAITFGLYYFSTHSHQAEKNFDQLTTDEMHDYVQNNIDEFDESVMGLYCCVNMQSNDYLFRSQQEQEEYIDTYFPGEIEDSSNAEEI